MRTRLFPFIIALSALAVSGSAAFYSVYGLSKLFAGASFQVMIMAGSLEFAKLVVASLLYQYWDTINRGLRAYLSIACFVLIIITSGGIYGFLSGAYQSTATQSELLDKSLMILNQKQVRFEEQKQDLKIEKQSITKSISDLRIALSNPAQVQYIDKESGQLITTSSSSARRALQTELNIATTSRDGINIKVEAVMDSINRTDMALLDREISNEAESELGPLKYLAEMTGRDMSVVVNWFLLLIIFVFDPLAIALVVAANMAFAQLTPTVKMSVPPGKKFNTPYPIPVSFEEPSAELKKRVKDNQAKLRDQEYSQDTWNNKVADLGINPNSITSSIKVEKQDLIMDDLETTTPKDVETGLDAWIEVLDNEEQDDKIDVQSESFKEKYLEQSEEVLPELTTSKDLTSEHDLYHGTDDKQSETADYLSTGKRRRVIKKTKKPQRVKGRHDVSGTKYKG